MRLFVFLMLLSTVSHGQQYKYFNEDGEEVDKKKGSYYYQEIVLKENDKCLIREFYSSDNSRKREAECEMVSATETSGVLELAGGRFIEKMPAMKGRNMNYREGGDPWYMMISGTGGGDLYAQYWHDGQPHLVRGTGVIRSEDKSQIEILDIRDSIIFSHCAINKLTRDTLYDHVEEPAYYAKDDLKFQNDINRLFAKEDKGGEAGGIFVEFIVDKQGNVSNVKVRDAGIGPVTTTLIETKFASLGKWTPAKVDGKPVKSTHGELVTF